MFQLFNAYAVRGAVKGAGGKGNDQKCRARSADQFKIIDPAALSQCPIAPPVKPVADLCLANCQEEDVLFLDGSLSNYDIGGRLLFKGQQVSIAAIQ